MIKGFCSNCAAYSRGFTAPQNSMLARGEPSGRRVLGECRRRAPYGESFPLVAWDGTDWCLDWVAKEAEDEL